MKRAVLSLILVITMICSCTFGVSAAKITDLSQLTLFLPEHVFVPGDIQVGLNGKYYDSVKVSVNSVFSAKATIEMKSVKDAVDNVYNALETDELKADLDAKTVYGAFNITVDFGSGISKLPSVAKDGSLSGFLFDGSSTSDIFEEVATSREVSGNTVRIEIKVKDGVTAGLLKNLPDKITLECPELTTLVGTEISGNVTGYTKIGGESDADPGYLGTINYKFIEKASEDIIAIQPAIVTIGSNGSGGGGGAGGGGGTETPKFTVKYESNGGTAFEDESYGKGKLLKLDKVPEREGYIFEGWYSDEALTKKVTSITIGADVTLYAAWTEIVEPLESHPVPEMLNGDDHFAYINGYTDGTVRPNSNITRAEVATIFFRLLKDDVREKYLTKENVFEDVNEDDWYNTAISTMANAGVVNGRFETVFAPEEYITRAEFTTICARFDEANETINNIFTDIDLHWASEYILEAVAYGWVEGYEDYTFRPDQFIERAEAITLINRVLNRIPRNKAALLDGMMTWSDNSNEDAWYYIAIQEAANSHKYTREETGYETWTELTEARDWTVYEK